MLSRLLPFLILLALPVFAQNSNSLTFNSSLQSVQDISSRLWQSTLERSKVSYFAEMSGPSAKKWDDNQINSDGSKSRDPINMWHSFNMQYRMFGKTSLFMSPRFYTAIGDRNDLRDNQDQSVVALDDWQFGFSQNWIKTNQFSWDTRISHRAPISSASKQENIDSQVELLQVLTWKPISQVYILSQSNVRYYQYENQVDSERYRLNQMTAISWMFNDKWRTQVFSEFDMQHRNSKEGAGHKDMNYLKKYKNIMAVGVGYNPIPTLTIMPFLKALNDQDIRPETMQIGFWVFGKVI
jgi:hypothetical protein